MRERVRARSLERDRRAQRSDHHHHHRAVRLEESMRMSSEDRALAIEEIQGADKAAAKIQAGFRGYRVRKRLQEERKSAKEDVSIEETPEFEEQQDHMGESTASSTLEDKSATKIQAGVRGFLVRKRQQAEQAAATRIQAGFRGFRTRKALKQSG